MPDDFIKNLPKFGKLNFVTAKEHFPGFIMFLFVGKIGNISVYVVFVVVFVFAEKIKNSCFGINPGFNVNI